MRRRSVSWWGAEDLYCLSNDERKRLASALANSATQEETFVSEIRNYVDRHLAAVSPSDIETNVNIRIRRVLEKFLFANGEIFAASVTKGELRSLNSPDLRSLIIEDIGSNPVQKDKIHTTDLVERVIQEILVGPTEAIRPRLRSLADAYTLMAFLRETPDVQSAVVKMFSQGDIWLDTSAVLPLFAENLQVPETQKFVLLARCRRGRASAAYHRGGLLRCPRLVHM
jgi:hypothetical protein